MSKRFQTFKNTFDSFKGSFNETKENIKESKKEMGGKSFKDLPKPAYLYMAIMLFVVIGSLYLAWVVTR